MSIDMFSMECAALDGATLAGFKGVEALNRPFEFEVFFTVPVGTDVRGAVGARATLTADRDDGRGPMCWQGILAGARLLHETAERALYRASLVPKLWLLGQYVRSFVHTKKKIDAYVGETLKHGRLTGGDFDFKIHVAAYPQEEFVCQYRESHLDFVHRWFEREGIYYYFEHPEGAGAAEKMVIVDDKAQHGPLLGDGHVRYFPAAGVDGSAGECLRELHADFRLLPASVLVTDYNYANPAAPVAGEKAVASGGQGEIREYGYRVFTEGEAKRLAQVKAQSIACRELVLSASGTYLGLRAGYTFAVDEGPSDLPSKYLATEVRHAGVVSGAAPMVMRYTGLDAKETYRVDVVAIPADVQYRAPQSTAWPRIYGFENGMVDGPGESQYAQIDDQGRYLVRFKFDASDLPDGSTSTYLRMMQPHGGTTEGWHFPLRKGTEVMVSFQGGDPDRPVIAGVVPNAVTPSNVTSRNNRQNVLRTGSSNYMVMDDTRGAEYIHIGTPGGKTQVFMGSPDYEGILTNGPDLPPIVPKVVEFPPEDPKDPPQEIHPRFSFFKGTECSIGFDIGGSWWQHVRGDMAVDVAVDSRVRIGGLSAHIVIGAAKEFHCGGLTHDVKGGLTQIVAPGGMQLVKGDWQHSVVATNTDVYGSWKSIVSGSWTALVGAEVAVTSGASVSISGATAITLRAPTVTINGAAVKVECPDFVETFSTAHSVGIERFDGAAFATSATAALKLDYASASIAYVGVKVEKVGAYAVDEGTRLDGTPLAIAQGAVRLFSAGFLRLG